jgi:prepilin peptidase dependent protein A/type IV fimbrial biogenesis protein FimT
MFKQSGLTLLELLFTISIIAVLAGIASPVLTTIQKNIQLKGVVETHYFALQQARHLAISKGSEVSLSFRSTGTWCVGLSDQGLCDCHLPNDCTVNSVEQIISQQDYAFISMTNVKFGKDAAAIFDGQRGLAIGHAGSVVFTDGSRQLKLILSNMGRVRICSLLGQVGSYKPC